MDEKAGKILRGQSIEQVLGDSEEISPFTTDIETDTVSNEEYRDVLWTGDQMQLVLMSVDPDDSIPLEKHEKGDQFICVEEGEVKVSIGEEEDDLNYKENLSADDAVIIPAGYWHIVEVVSDKPAKLYLLYAPPEH